MGPDMWLLVAQTAAGLALALVLEYVLHRRYEDRWTWLTVVWGVGQVGLLVAARLALAPPPALPPDAIAWWVWRLTFWSFVAAGFPIILWQILLVMTGARRSAVQSIPHTPSQ